MRTKRGKRLLAGLLSAVMVLGLCACGDGGKSTGKKEGDKTVVTMSYWNTESSMRPLLDLLAEKLPDIEVQFNFTANTSYGVTTRTKLLSGSADDIVGFAMDAHPPLAKQGLFEDITDIVGDNFNFAPEDYIDGKIYFVPLATWYEGIYYNIDLFEENNIEIPTTFDEFLDVCAEFESLGIKPFVIGAGTASTLLKNMLGYVQAEYMLEEEGKDFNEKFGKGEAKIAECLTPYIEEWSEIVKEGYINASHLGMDENQAPDEFVTGVAAMWSSGTWNYNLIKQKNMKLNFGLLPYFGSTPEKTSVVGTTGGGFLLSKSSKNKEAARRVLEVMASKEGQLAMCAGQPGSSSQRKDVQVELPEGFEPVKKTIEEGRIMCSWVYWPTGTFDSVSRALQGVVSNPATSIKGELQKIDAQAAKQLQVQE